MTTTTTKTFDASKLSPRERRSFEAGMEILRRKLQGQQPTTKPRRFAVLADVLAPAVPGQHTKTFTLADVLPAAKRFTATRTGRTRTYHTFCTFAGTGATIWTA